MTGISLAMKGDTIVSREQLIAVPTPEPRGRYFPIAHDYLLNKVENHLEAGGLKIGEAVHGISHDGDRYFGLMRLEDPNDKDFSLAVGLRNSHDQSVPAALVLGAHVFVCSNLSFHGEVKLARKHTTNILRDLDGVVARSIGQLMALKTSQQNVFDRYKETELSELEVHDMLVRGIDIGIPAQKIPHVLKEWRNPSHPEFAESRTAWRLWNAYTESLKSGNINDLPSRTLALHGMFNEAVGLGKVATSAEVLGLQGELNFN